MLASKSFEKRDVLTDYGGELVDCKEGRDRCKSLPENTMGYMCEFTHKGCRHRRDATEEKPR